MDVLYAFTTIAAAALLLGSTTPLKLIPGNVSDRRFRPRRQGLGEGRRSGRLRMSGCLTLALSFGVTPLSETSGSELAGMTISPVESVSRAPDVMIRSLDGESVYLNQFQGKPVLISFWAASCEICIENLSALDRFSEQVGDRLKVVAVSIDRGGTDAVAPVLRGLSLRELQVYVDSEERLGSTDPRHVVEGALPLYGGVPLTYVLDKEGNALGYIGGPVRWDSAGTLKRIEDFLKGLGHGLRPSAVGSPRRAIIQLGRAATDPEG